MKFLRKRNCEETTAAEERKTDTLSLDVKGILPKTAPKPRRER